MTPTRRRLDAECRALVKKILRSERQPIEESDHCLLQRCWPKEGFRGIPPDHWGKDVTKATLRKLSLRRTKKVIKLEPIRDTFARHEPFGVRVDKADLDFHNHRMTTKRCIRILRELGDTHRTARLWRNVRVISLPALGKWWSVACSEALVKILEGNGNGVFSLNFGDAHPDLVYKPLLDAIERGSVQIVIAWMGQESQSFPNNKLRGPDGLLRKNRRCWEDYYRVKNAIPPWRCADLVAKWSDTDWGKPLWHPCVAFSDEAKVTVIDREDEEVALAEEIQQQLGNQTETTMHL